MRKIIESADYNVEKTDEGIFVLEKEKNERILELVGEFGERVYTLLDQEIFTDAFRAKHYKAFFEHQPEYDSTKKLNCFGAHYFLLKEPIPPNAQSGKIIHHPSVIELSKKLPVPFDLESISFPDYDSDNLPYGIAVHEIFRGGRRTFRNLKHVAMAVGDTPNNEILCIDKKNRSNLNKTRLITLPHLLEEAKNIYKNPIISLFEIEKTMQKNYSQKKFTKQIN